MIRTLIVLCAAVLPAHLFAQGTPGSGKPHILLVMADDLSWMDLHCQGNPVLRTPQLDGLALQGVRFTNAYAASPVSGRGWVVSEEDRIEGMLYFHGGDSSAFRATRKKLR